MNAENVAGSAQMICSREAKFRRQKMDEKSRFGELFTEEIMDKKLGTRPSQKQQKKPQSSGWYYLTVRIRCVSLKVTGS